MGTYKIQDSRRAGAVRRHCSDLRRFQRQGRYYKSTQGDRSLHNIFMSLAIRQLVVHRGTKTPRNPAFLEYFHRMI
ncbi:hypothetical protein J4772_22015 [Cohnella sp. LGH]|uniref:hypothetical protein n=1 Tax=Cohnella sp. LGH TaxID=1619153 RepID=UPI001AD98BF1|nr:hypothetical protein [Cohnella sp. LGH]QTH40265.1 hypothetical protein J4772_22015 [Cohnella sp. LGH]